jgi:hypothetical protein
LIPDIEVSIEPDISSLLDEVMARPAAARPALATSQATIAPRLEAKRIEKVDAFKGLRLLLCVPFFLLFVISLVVTALFIMAAFLDISFGLFEKGGGVAAGLRAGNFAGVIAGMIGFSISAFFYWIGESIRLGRIAKPSDVFAPDAFKS